VPASVEDLFEYVSNGPLFGLRLAKLHGQMAAADKDQVMADFAAGAIDVLIATTVVEVGVDVPNASTMLVMDADRFGVSQLHQLRGRVGRGKVPGLCLLVTYVEEFSPSFDRLKAVASTLDGFELSRIDLQQRREGDVLGANQSGKKSSLKVLNVVQDEDLIVKARDLATEIVLKDSDLKNAFNLGRRVHQILDDSRTDYLEKA
jgi:ATP-dependent DNA helicase RecG